MSLRRYKADKKTSPGDVFVFGASFTFANIFRVCEVADRASFHFTLIKLFAVFHLCIGNKLFDALFILFLADQEDITGFGHDAIIDALYDGKTFRIVEGNNIAVAFVHYRFAFQERIVLFVFLRQVKQRSPCSEVSPTKVDTEHIYVVCFFHDPVVDGDIQAVRKVLGDEIAFFRRVALFFAQVETEGDVGEEFGECFQYGVDVPDEKTGIPEKLATLHEYFCQFQVWLLSKSFHFREFAQHDIAALDISVACFGTAWFDAQRNQRIVIFYEVETFLYVFQEDILFQNQMIGGGDNYICIRVASLDMICRISDARSCITTCRFQ